MALNKHEEISDFDLDISSANSLNGTDSVSSSDSFVTSLMTDIDLRTHNINTHPLLVDLTEEINQESYLPQLAVPKTYPSTPACQSSSQLDSTYMETPPCTSAVPTPISSTESVSLKRKHNLPDRYDCPATKVAGILPNFEHNDSRPGNRTRRKCGTQVKSSPFSNDFDLNGTEVNIFPHDKISGNESSTFDQVLEIFPRIDKIFLRNECRKGLDTNLLTERILQMNNNYPIDNQFQDMLPVFDQVCATTSYIVKNDPTTSSVSANTKPASEIPSTSELDQSSTNLNENKNLNIEVGVGLEHTVTETISNFTLPHDPHTEQFEFLISIFPDADHNFLEEKSKLGEDDIRNFISVTLESKDYPKKKVVQVEEDLDDVGLYTTSFSVKNFLEVFPDPFAYFMDESRVCQQSTHAFEFLKRRYRKHLYKTLNQTYKRLKFNLTLTCDYFDANKQKYETRAVPRSRNEIKMPTSKNTPFLKEACFIEHKNEIKEYMDGKAEEKALAYQQAKDKGELIECNCCYDQVLFEECAACNEGDLFCKICIVKYVEVRIGDGHITFPCLLSCGSEFSLQLLQMSEVKAANIEGLEDCPFCEFATIPPPDTNIFTCLNPECLKESCRSCHKINHIPLRCEEVENDDQARARKYIEDEMTKALVRECYQCKKSFVKTDGCNKMTCTCGARMCYVCRKPVKDYTHFNGQGGSETHKCPLYSSEESLHVHGVREVAEKALKAVKEANPELQLKHDPTKLLPKTPKKQDNTNVANAQPFHNELGAHFIGMMNFAPYLGQRIHRLQVHLQDIVRHGEQQINQQPLNVLAAPDQGAIAEQPLPQVNIQPQIHLPRVHRARARRQTYLIERLQNAARRNGNFGVRDALPIHVPNARVREAAAHTVVNGAQPPAPINLLAYAPAQYQARRQTLLQVLQRHEPQGLTQVRGQAPQTGLAQQDRAEARGQAPQTRTVQQARAEARGQAPQTGTVQQAEALEEAQDQLMLDHMNAFINDINFQMDFGEL